MCVCVHDSTPSFILAPATAWALAPATALRHLASGEPEKHFQLLATHSTGKQGRTGIRVPGGGPI